MRDLEIDLNHDKGHICSTIKVFDIQSNKISENMYEYWIYNCIFNYSLKIGKNSEYGERLLELITNNADIIYYDELFTEIILKNIKPLDLLSHIEELKRDYIDKGERKMQHKIKNLLGL